MTLLCPLLRVVDQFMFRRLVSFRVTTRGRVPASGRIVTFWPVGICSWRTKFLATPTTWNLNGSNTCRGRVQRAQCAVQSDSGDSV
jgi:hypothetical protein